MNLFRRSFLVPLCLLVLGCQKQTNRPEGRDLGDHSYIQILERIERAGEVKGYWIGAPDLAVEVTSPGDTKREVDNKVAEWLEAGARMVWVVSPKLRTVTVYRSLTDIVVLAEKDTLDGGDVVPGFQIRVAEIFSS